MIPSIVNQLLQETTKKLAPVSRAPVIDAEVIMAFVLKISREELIIHPPQSISESQQKTFTKLINNRATGMPLAYLIGRKEFYTRDFLVTPDVLIPRPESELIIDAVKQYAAKKTAFKLIELGTGSGAIAISLALECPQAKITATDISAKALKIAKANAQQYQTNINFIQTDLIKNIRPFDFDILVANLPYVPTPSLKHPTNADTIGLKFEPRLALDGGPRGIDVYKKLLSLLPKKKLPSLMLWEIDPRQTNWARQMIRANLKPDSIKFIKDLAGLNRIGVINNMKNSAGQTNF